MANSMNGRANGNANGILGRKLDIAIVGGGIGGICLAIGLEELGHLNVQIYESAPVFSEIGAGLTLGPNARRAMDLLSPSLTKVYTSQATSNLWPERKHSYMHHIVGHGPQAGRVFGQLTNPGGQQSVHRGKFLDAMAALVPRHLCNFNKRLDTIQEDQLRPDARITLHFSDGTTAQADAVIGADGIHSGVRKYLLGPDHPAAKSVYTGSTSYRRIAPMEDARAMLGAEHAENSTILCGPGKFLFTYPLDGGEAINMIIADFTRDTWQEEQWTRPAPRDELKAAFKGWSEQTHRVIDLLTEDPNLQAWAMHHHLPAPYYARRRICIMGDAAHASTPYQGQGAAHAMEDATVLQALLARVHDVAQLPAALSAYDLTRRARTQKVVTTSIETGRLLAMQMPGVEDDVDKLEAQLKDRFRWLWYRDLEKQNRAALEVFEEHFMEWLE